MSEKRFIETERACYYTTLVFDNQTQEELGTPKVVEFLNELAEENKQLKQKVDFYKYFQKDARELEKENEQLREELSDCEKFRHSVFKRIEKTIENKKNCAINEDAKYPCKAYDECLKRKGTNKPLPCMVNWMMGRPFENMIRKEGDDE